LAHLLDLATQQALAARLRFYRDLGLTEFYRRPVDPALMRSVADSATDESISEKSEDNLETMVAGLEPSIGHPSFIPQEQPIPARKVFSAPPQITGIIPPAEREAALRVIREDIGDCTRCALHQGRNKLVFADGSAQARLMFVGEGPGADEDAQGLPFVGRAGQLLNNMISAMGLKREEVYIANVVKCRPPGNRTPEPEEANTCSPFLFRQIDVVRPEVLVALGATAATYLLGQRQPLAGLRGRVHSVRGARLIVTYHPAYLLRDPRQKKEAWADLQIAMRELGLKPNRG
jgi:DNA polymerase